MIQTMVHRGESWSTPHDPSGLVSCACDLLGFPQGRCRLAELGLEGVVFPEPWADPRACGSKNHQARLPTSMFMA